MNSIPPKMRRKKTSVVEAQAKSEFMFTPIYYNVYNEIQYKCWRLIDVVLR